MKLLADMGVSRHAVATLRAEGHDIVHLLDRGLERLEDSAIVDLALLEHRVILTFDLDFADLLASRRSEQPSTVIFRISNATPVSVLQHLRPILENTRNDLTRGAIVVVEDGRYRVRKLPIV